MTQKSSGSTARDAVALLTADHDKVKKLFHEFERCDADDQDLKQDLAQQICMELTIHATIEEEIFYPAVRAETGDKAQVDEALEEHAKIKEMVEEIRSMAGGDDLDQAVQKLRECVEHHVGEEEQEMFPAARQSDADLTELRAQLEDRKEELEHDFGAAPMRGSKTEAGQSKRSSGGHSGTRK